MQAFQGRPKVGVYGHIRRGPFQHLGVRIHVDEPLIRSEQRVIFRSDAIEACADGENRIGTCECVTLKSGAINVQMASVGGMTIGKNVHLAIRSHHRRRQLVGEFHQPILRALVRHNLSGDNERILRRRNKLEHGLERFRRCPPSGPFHMGRGHGAIDR